MNVSHFLSQQSPTLLPDQETNLALFLQLRRAGKTCRHALAAGSPLPPTARPPPPVSAVRARLRVVLSSYAGPGRLPGSRHAGRRLYRLLGAPAPQHWRPVSAPEPERSRPEAAARFSPRTYQAPKFTFGLNRSMDLAPFKLDIDELLDDYAKENCTSFTDFKSVWTAKKFSYIYEGRPKTNSGVFMQSLFLHCIGHMTSQSSLCQRLAGFYCLYCLYECQPYKPHFKIYLSLEESKQLKEFVVEAKQSGIGLVPALVKRMLDKGMFLFGFINLLGDHGAKQVDELNAFHTKRVKFACDKLFANTQIGRYTHTDLGEELELDTIKKLSMDYAKAKELGFAEASQTVDVEDAKHILQNDKLLGDRVEEIVKEWDAQKEEFYQKTGVSPGDELAVVDNDESGEFLDENNGHTELAVIDNDKSGEFYDENDGFDELEQLLLE